MRNHTKTQREGLTGRGAYKKSSGCDEGAHQETKSGGWISPRVRQSGRVAQGEGETATLRAARAAHRRHKTSPLGCRSPTSQSAAGSGLPDQGGAGVSPWAGFWQGLLRMRAATCGETNGEEFGLFVSVCVTFTLMSTGGWTYEAG